ncbi:lysylphosphatidylglycerol synthase transmembrane domain-containing protein [soil metagenome]
MTRGLERIDFGVALLLVPLLQGVSFGLEALGWQAILRTLGERPSFRALLRVRIISEAIAQSLPLGVLVAEGAKPVLLRAHTGVAIPTGTASVAARKYSLVAAQALLLALVALFGRVAGGSTVLRLVIGGGAIVLATSAAYSGRALSGGATANAVRRLIARLPILGPIAKRHEKGFSEADRAAERYFGMPLAQRARRALPFFLAWCVESFETWFLLRLASCPVTLYDAFCIEVPLGLLRSVAFFTPAGLGVQDLGYASMLAAFGVPDAAATALGFVVLKRAKEILWGATGYVLLGLSRSADKRASAEPGTVANATGVPAERALLHTASFPNP